MMDQNPLKVAENLERRIAGANMAGRLALQPELSVVIKRLQDEGQQVPLRLRRLDAALCDEAVEARFDNFPV